MFKLSEGQDGFRISTLSHDSCSLINHLHKCCARTSMHFTQGQCVQHSKLTCKISKAFPSPVWGGGPKAMSPLATHGREKGSYRQVYGLIYAAFFSKDSGTLILIGQLRLCKISAGKYGIMTGGEKCS